MERKDGPNMKKRTVTLLLAAALAGSLLLAGCTPDSDSSSAGSGSSYSDEEGSVSEETDTETATVEEGTLQAHCVWYDAEGVSLSGISVTFSNGMEILYNDSTDENGKLESFTLPGNTTLSCTVTDGSGEELASMEMQFSISSDYSDLTVYPVHTDEEEEETEELLVEVPSEKTDVRIAFFINEDGTITIGNITVYSESYDEETESTDSESTDSESTDSESTDSESTDSEATESETTESEAADSESTTE